jgi:hypothetical protein
MATVVLAIKGRFSFRPPPVGATMMGIFGNDDWAILASFRTVTLPTNSLELL